MRAAQETRNKTEPKDQLIIMVGMAGAHVSHNL